MSKKRTIKIEKDGNLLRIGKKWYAFHINDDGDFRTGQHIMVEVDKAEFDKKVNAITAKLFSFIDPKLVLKDALKDMTDEELTHLFRYIEKHKGKVKPRIRKHCISMDLAGVNIPIR